MESAEGKSGTYDIVVVGGGPTGLFAAFYAGLRKMSTAIIDAMPELGGQLIALYPEKHIYDVAGFPRVLARQLVERLKEQALYYKPDVLLGEAVTVVQPDAAGGFEVLTDRRRLRARSVLVAAGIGRFEPKRLEAEGIDRFEGRGVYYMVSDLSRFVGKSVLVVGGGDSAFDWALMLKEVARELTLIHRSDRFRALEDSVARLAASRATIRPFHELKAVHGDDVVRAATIFDNRTGTEERLAVDAVVIAIGFASSIGPIAEWGLEMEGNAVRVNTQMETNIPGIYAAGDIVTYPGKVKLIATGFGEAATAVNNAKHFVDPRAKVQAAHSTSLR
ncbi:MAG: NAD(P)/FAD-dependent oxidoreductase [Clostridia bacterium]|nr:NAD(P)/FAD-dependent oxidoreductase [Clostridia bacterium]